MIAVLVQATDLIAKREGEDMFDNLAGIPMSKKALPREFSPLKLFHYFVGE